MKNVEKISPSLRETCQKLTSSFLPSFFPFLSLKLRSSFSSRFIPDRREDAAASVTGGVNDCSVEDDADPSGVTDARSNKGGLANFFRQREKILTPYYAILFVHCVNSL